MAILLFLSISFGLLLFSNVPQPAIAAKEGTKIDEIVENFTSKKPETVALESNPFLEHSTVVLPRSISAGMSQRQLNTCIDKLKRATQEERFHKIEVNQHTNELLEQLEAAKPEDIKVIKTVAYRFPVDSYETLNAIKSALDSTKYRAFICETDYDLLEPEPSEFKTVELKKAMIIKIDSLSDLLRLFGTEGRYSRNLLGVNAERVRKLVLHWDKSHGVDIERLEPGILSLRFKRKPQDYNVLVSQIVKVCPDYMKNCSKEQRIQNLKSKQEVTLSLKLERFGEIYDWLFNKQ